MGKKFNTTYKYNCNVHHTKVQTTKPKKNKLKICSHILIPGFRETPTSTIITKSAFERRAENIWKEEVTQLVFYKHGRYVCLQSGDANVSGLSW